LTFLRQAYQTQHPDLPRPLYEFRSWLLEEAKALGIKADFINRYINDGFSGGEKKRLEILQLRILKPKYAVFDETDSGLDIDGLKLVSLAINQSVKQFNLGCLVITHYQRILKYVKPDFVHVMVGGWLVESGGKNLIRELEKTGYKKYL